MRLFPLILPFFALLGACASISQAPAPAAPSAKAPEPVEVGIIALNDFHGALEPPKLAIPVTSRNGSKVLLPAGGAAWLADAVKELRAHYRYSLTVSAGDLTSASQLASSLFLDEPSVGVMNRIGLDFNAVGNHEFDRGSKELLRLQNGGCEKNSLRQPCAVEDHFPGASYRYLAANVVRQDGSTLFPGTALRQFGHGAEQVTIGLVGLTLKGTPALVSPGGVKGLTFTDEADTINRATASLRQRGADAVIVLIHQGLDPAEDNDPNSCDGAAGGLLPIVNRLNPGVDLIVSGHTHRAYICKLPQAGSDRKLLVTSAGKYGTMLTDIRLKIDPRSGIVQSRSAHNVVVQSEAFRQGDTSYPVHAAFPHFTPDQAIADYVGLYTAAADRFASRKVGQLAGVAEKEEGHPDRGGALGRLIADSQLAATRDAGAQIAFMNPFGIRATLAPAEDGSVTFADIYKVQPFNNQLITATFTGAQLKRLLEQQFDAEGPPQILSASQGFRFTYDTSRPEGERILSMSLNGQPVMPQETYRITSNSFLAGGGDFFTVFTEGGDPTIGVQDLVALEQWLDIDHPRPLPQEPRAINADE
ncbi:bifunctional metallophosphatase/5'-nucleotidase [Altericroceibacterium spongiae]|uniref:Bifunctional metallophosphatase/5'-nucleotidase n=1 Tax=Altericroceibacterium spongiae TaxID=2320269 RepID=A0A420EPF2_9SPHN|nr:bifunctional metallophosphatase/5'-nucleotidase [Altericroceibacterium spongiae]RKF22556.1 bifunctional metallophosphatase/5'-nucleotidase [Altericroceibacterium spongiae]